MAWTDLKATGSGNYAFRLVIDGWPEQFVTHSSMVKSLADGRERILGLNTRGLRIAETIDPVKAEIKARGWTAYLPAGLNDPIGSKVTTSLAKIPQAVTYLEADLNQSEVLNATVTDTSDFTATNGVVHIGTEALSYTSKSATGFHFLGRGVWDTQSQKHFAPAGDALAYPEITDRPVLMSGRRCVLYAYGAGDSPQGDGHQVWRGSVGKEPVNDGRQWAISLDPITSILDASLGGEYETPVGIRGIYYNKSNPLLFTLVEYWGSGPSSFPKTSVIIGFHGFFETQLDFCSALTVAISNAKLSSACERYSSSVEGRIIDPTHVDYAAANWKANQTITAEEDGDIWRFVFRTPSTSDNWTMAFIHGDSSPIDPKMITPNRVSPLTGGGSTNISPSSGYAFIWDYSAGSVASAGTVPRATFGIKREEFGRSEDPSWHSRLERVGRPFWTNNVSIFSGETSEGSNTNRVYLATEIPSTGLSATVEFPENGEFPSSKEEYPSASLITSLGSPSLFPPGTVNAVSALVGTIGLRCFTREAMPSFRLMRFLSSGSEGTFKGFLDGLVDSSPGLRNVGLIPAIDSDDIVVPDWLQSKALDNPITSGRRYIMAKEHTLKDLVSQECRLLGAIPFIDSLGRINFTRLRLPGSGEAADFTLDKQIIDRGNFGATEFGREGIINTWILLTEYNQVEDAHEGEKFIVRDISSFSRAPTRSRALKIEPLSLDPRSSFSYEDVVDLAGPVLGTFGGSYFYVTMEFPLTNLDVHCGSVVKFSSPYVPNSSGTMGVTNKVGIVLSRKVEFREGKIEITLLCTDTRMGGYAPGGAVSTWFGTALPSIRWTATVESDYFPDGKTAADFFQTGDRVRVFRRGSTDVSGNLNGTVVSAALNHVVIDFDSNFHDGGLSWGIGYVGAVNAVQQQQRFAFQADGSGKCNFPTGSIVAYTFA